MSSDFASAEKHRQKLFAPTGIYLGIQKWLAFCDYPASTIEKVQKIWALAGIPITALPIAIYLFRTLRYGRFEGDYLSFTKAKYVIYPAESRFEVYAYDPGRYTYADTPQKFTAAANKERYDRLAAMIPNTYVRADLRPDSAKKGKMLWATTYTDTGDGGKRTSS